jgi:hypothetical protein
MMIDRSGSDLILVTIPKKSVSQDSWFPGRDLNSGPPEAGMR